METIEMVGRPTKTARTMTASERSKRRTFKLQAQAQLGKDLLSALIEEKLFAKEIAEDNLEDEGRHVRSAMCVSVMGWAANTMDDSIKKLDLTTAEAVDLLHEILPDEFTGEIEDALAEYKKFYGVTE